MERPFARLMAAPSPSRIPVIPLAPVLGKPSSSRRSTGRCNKPPSSNSAIPQRQPPGRPSTAQLTNNAIWAPTVSDREVDLVSRRLHNYEYNPVWGFLTDQSWLG